MNSIHPLCKSEFFFFLRLFGLTENLKVLCRLLKVRVCLGYFGFDVLFFFIYRASCFSLAYFS